MEPASLEMGIIFLTQTGAGILGNSSLLCLYSFTLLTGHNLRPTDLILNQLVLANNLVLFSRGIPQTMAAFGWKYFLDDAGCKVVFYFHRVARGLSIITTCLLSGFQASNLCPSSSRWMVLRMRSLKCTGFCCSLCWILQLLVNAYIPVRVIGPRNTQNISAKTIYGYCSTLNSDRFKISLHAVMFSSIDVICLGLMVLSSGTMVFVLLRHKNQVQHIYSNSLAPRPSHEARATCTILILVSSFVFFYSLSSISGLFITLIVTPSQWLVNMSVFLASCFPTFSPFLLITSDTRISKLSFAFCVRKAFFT
ncbi:vomeronasal type-1 receptor 1-like [Loxodonta africana]|uniref:vomeronasal type-1 receptor 1-like n=1 Tax=Loxodonta africana TaxID=9785 RepID=UPI0002233A92|nr:vomeronasal type-1 receptor 1-like [Loxodonta africana]